MCHSDSLPSSVSFVEMYRCPPNLSLQAMAKFDKSWGLSLEVGRTVEVDTDGISLSQSFESLWKSVACPRFIFCTTADRRLDKLREIDMSSESTSIVRATPNNDLWFPSIPGCLSPSFACETRFVKSETRSEYSP